MATNQKRCALCSVPITAENESAEHIIPNAIGGRRKVHGFICRKCNSTKGNEWDAELARQMNWFSLNAGIKRERGEPPAMEVDMVGGEKVRIRSDGSLESREIKLKKDILSNGKVRLHLVAPSMSHAERMLEGWKKKHPKTDLHPLKKQLEIKEINNPVLHANLQFGGHAAGRSAVKTACAMAAHCGLAMSDYELSAKHLRSATAEPTHGLFYARDLVEKRPSEGLFHCTSIQADNARNLLLGYVEYFSFARFVVILSDTYHGPDISETYAINPSTGQEIKLVVNVNLNDHELKLIRDGEPPNALSYKSALEHVLPIILGISKKRAFEREISQAWDKTYKDLNLIPGQEMTEELARKITDRLMKEINPYISKLVRR